MKAENVLEILDIFSEKIIKEKDYLTELDAATGDSDHGINMEKGILAYKEKATDFKNESLQNIFKNFGMIVMSKVGGASGALYGTAFIKSAKAVGNADSIDNKLLLTILEEALAGIKMRGRAVVGEKTLVDTLEPAVECYRTHLESNCEIEKLMTEFKESAKKGMESTKDMVAKKGRAHYQGENSRGHLDPGAVSLYYLLEIIADYVLNKR
ncbi:dihydroxyacetone kinase subunit DhaL [Abyssisolibacter fermentans]|uniref:dihydroxyacetone kinase subunit DhaL n=1 Tax=Abyssisolibacter fermentans TaxID=1766203 RepID=UPI0008325EBD|nr:dihydroxyacetone kinase subunit DhaL [Abyssisolibacter fermentans]